MPILDKITSTYNVRQSYELIPQTQTDKKIANCQVYRRLGYHA